jgi:hypothetical protein
MRRPSHPQGLGKLKPLSTNVLVAAKRLHRLKPLLFIPTLLSSKSAALGCQTARLLQSTIVIAAFSKILCAACKALGAPGGYTQQYTAHSRVLVLPVFANSGWKEGLDTLQGKLISAPNNLDWPDHLYSAWLEIAGQPCAAGGA